jgi:hypothetical protein
VCFVATSRRVIKVEEFKRALTEQVKEAGLLMRDESTPDRGINLYCFPWPNPPFWLKVESGAKNGVVVRGVVRAEGLSGDRTDIHDILGALWSILLHSTGNVQLFMQDMPHPVVPNEIHSRSLLLAPAGAEDRLLVDAPASLEWIRGVCEATAAAAPLMTASFEHPHPETHVEKQPAWVTAVAALTGDDLEHGDVSVNHRLEGAMWQHFRGFDTGVCVYRLTPGIMDDLRQYLASRAAALAAATELMRKMIENDKNRAEFEERPRLAVAVAKAVDAAVGAGAEEPVLMLTRSHAIAVGKACIAEVSWASGPGECDEDDEDHEFDDD